MKFHSRNEKVSFESLNTSYFKTPKNCFSMLIFPWLSSIWERKVIISHINLNGSQPRALPINTQ